MLFCGFHFRGAKLRPFEIRDSRRCQNAQNVCFPLEGYLFPATYTFKKNSDPTAVIDKLVETFQSRFTDDMKAKAASMGRSVHEVLTVASIIEKEAYTPEQRTLISSVLYNRLNAK